MQSKWERKRICGDEKDNSEPIYSFTMSYFRLSNNDILIYGYIIYWLCADDFDSSVH